MPSIIIDPKFINPDELLRDAPGRTMSEAWRYEGTKPSSGARKRWVEVETPWRDLTEGEGSTMPVQELKARSRNKMYKRSLYGREHMAAIRDRATGKIYRSQATHGEALSQWADAHGETQYNLLEDWFAGKLDNVIDEGFVDQKDIFTDRQQTAAKMSDSFVRDMTEGGMDSSPDSAGSAGMRAAENKRPFETRLNENRGRQGSFEMVDPEGNVIEVPEERVRDFRKNLQSTIAETRKAAKAKASPFLIRKLNALKNLGRHAGALGMIGQGPGLLRAAAEWHEGEQQGEHEDQRAIRLMQNIFGQELGIPEPITIIDPATKKEQRVYLNYDEGLL